MRRLLLPIVLALVLAVSGCGGDDTKADSGPTPAEALAAAKQKLDKAQSVRLSLSTNSKPDKGDAVLAADGVLTRQPAFDGTVKVLLMGFTADVPVISVDGKVRAKLPMTPGWSEIDPGDYGAPDPADFADPDSGLSALLAKLQSPRRTGKARAGSKVVTTYAGKLPGTAVKAIIPSASADDTYDTTVSIDDDGYVTSVSATGDFFSTGSGDVTYDLTLDDYDKSVTVKAP